MVPLEEARWKLGSIWFFGAGLIMILLIVQSLMGVYGDRVQGVWGWALPNIVPTLSLMIGVFAGAALLEHAESDTMKVRRPFVRLAMGLSIFHLLAVAATLLAQPWGPTISGDEDSYDVMMLFDVSNLWLGPLQGLVAAVLGVMFYSKTSDGKGDDATGIGTPTPVPAPPAPPTGG
jgi:hypothetical protein